LKKTDHPGKQHVEVALDSFIVEGCNGRHFCKVLDPLGVCLRDVLDEAFEHRADLNEPENWLGLVLPGDKWSGKTAKRICWQILLGLDYLHSQGVAHRDLQGGNVCLGLEYDIDALCENAIQRAVWGTELQEKVDETASGEGLEEGLEDDVEDQSKVIEEAGRDQRWDEDEPTTPEDDSSDDSSASDTSSQKAWQLAWISGKVLDLAKWQELSLSPGSKTATPHSTSWNKANFLLSKPDIELLRLKSGEPLPPDNIQYTVSPTPLTNSCHVSEETQFVLTDLGFSRAFDECEKYPLFNVPDFRCPETLIGIPATHKADIFSLGLLFWEVMFLRRLIENRYRFPDHDMAYSKARMMRDLAQRLGPLPEGLRGQWKEWEQWVDGEGRALDPQEVLGNGKTRDEQEEGEDVWTEEDFEYGDIWWHARRRKPLDMDDGEMESFVDLLLSMMQWEPGKRPSTEELMRHRWFEGMQ
jgi:serine/threonine protein kinase